MSKFQEPDFDEIFYAVSKFKEASGLNPSEIFFTVGDKRCTLSNEEWKQFAVEMNVVVFDFYDAEKTHLGFVDGGFWQLKEAAPGVNGLPRTSNEPWPNLYADESEIPKG